MNLFDIIIIIIISYCLIRGLFRGLIKEIASILGVFGAFYAAYTYYPLMAKSLSQWISNDAYLNIMAFVVLFVVIFLLISILGSLIKYALKLALLGWFDRLSGALFGAIKGVLIVSVLLIIFTSFLSKNSAFIGNSLLSPHVVSISEVMSHFIPQEMKRDFISNTEGFKEVWKKRK
jgi:membrane protein required for colicin V production